LPGGISGDVQYITCSLSIAFCAFKRGRYVRRDDGFMRRGVQCWERGHWEAHLHPRVAWRLMNEVWGVRRSPDVLTIREFEALKL
jgi:hypothetical protein